MSEGFWKKEFRQYAVSLTGPSFWRMVWSFTLTLTFSYCLTGLLRGRNMLFSQVLITLGLFAFAELMVLGAIRVLGQRMLRSRAVMDPPPIS